VTGALHRNAAGKTPRQPRRPAAQVQVIRVNQGVMREALRQAGGDASRIRIISPTCVEVGPGAR
jgi:hypothetical protein